MKSASNALIEIKFNTSARPRLALANWLNKRPVRFLTEKMERKKLTKNRKRKKLKKNRKRKKRQRKKTQLKTIKGPTRRWRLRGRTKLIKG